MIVLGFTGGVGSGKSTILQEISNKYNVELIFTDELAKTMMESDSRLIEKLNKEFINDNIFDNTGKIDRDKLSGLVFGNRDKLKALNSIVHPEVKKQIIDIINKKKSEEKIDLLIVEAALLLEEEYDKLFDCIYVYAEKDVRIHRLLKERGYSKEKTESVIKSQLKDEVYRNRCKYTIDNSGDIKDSLEETYRILSNYGLRRKDG